MTTYHDPHEVRPADAVVREAVRFGLTSVGVGAGALAVAAVWASTCTGGVADGVACGAPELMVLALVGPAILLVAGVRAFVRARRHEASLVWQATGWFLVVLTVVMLALAVPTLVGPVMNP